MGTSKGYDAPKTPQWAATKTDITNAAQIHDIEPARISSMLGKYVEANGGPLAMAGGRGAIGSGKSAQAVMRNLGEFSERVASDGIRSALSDAGLSNAGTASPSEIATFLTDFLSDGSATIDDADARAAMSRLLRELLHDGTLDTVDEVLENALRPENLPYTMNLYFANYLFEQFCRVGYDRLVAKVGEAQAEAFLGEIRRYILAETRGIANERDLARVDWRGSQGATLADEIFENVLNVFGG